MVRIFSFVNLSPPFLETGAPVAALGDSFPVTIYCRVPRPLIGVLVSLKGGRAGQGAGKGRGRAGGTVSNPRRTPTQLALETIHVRPGLKRKTPLDWGTGLWCTETPPFPPVLRSRPQGLAPPGSLFWGIVVL